MECIHLDPPTFWGIVGAFKKKKKTYPWGAVIKGHLVLFVTGVAESVNTHQYDFILEALFWRVKRGRRRGGGGCVAICAHTSDSTGTVAGDRHYSTGNYTGTAYYCSNRGKKNVTSGAIPPWAKGEVEVFF